MEKTLEGKKILLSGGLPDRGQYEEGVTREDIFEFVARLTACVLERGGTLVHGCHPDFINKIYFTLNHFPYEGKDKLVIFRCTEYFPDYFYDDQRENPLVKIEALKKITKEEEGLNLRETNLKAFREKLLFKDIDYLVAIGGATKFDIPDQRPGVIEEIKTAVKNKIPCNLAIAFGGCCNRKMFNYLTKNKFTGPFYPESNIDFEDTFHPQAIIKRIEDDIKRKLKNKEFLQV